MRWNGAVRRALEFAEMVSPSIRSTGRYPVLRQRGFAQLRSATRWNPFVVRGHQVARSALGGGDGASSRLQALVRDARFRPFDPHLV